MVLFSNIQIANFCCATQCTLGEAKTINGEVHLHALVDGKKIMITESTVRRDLQLEDAEGADCLPNSTISKQLTLIGSKTTAWNEFSSTMASAIICLATNQKFNFSKYIFESKSFSGRVTPLFQTMVVQNQSELGEGSTNPTDPHHTPTIIQSLTQPKKTQKPRKPKRKDTQVPQPSDPSENVANEVVHKELGDSLVRAATTASSLEAAGQWCQETIGDTTTRTRFKIVSKHFNDSLLARGNTLRSDKDRLKLEELMALGALNGEEVFVAGQNENVVEEVVDVAQVSTAATTVTITTEEITLAQALEALKTSKPKVKGIGFFKSRLNLQQQQQYSSTITNNGNLKTMFEPHVEDAVWRNEQDYKVLDWKLYDSCRGRIVGIKSLLDAVRIITAQVYVNTALMNLKRRRVKKLEKKDRSRIHRLKRLYKVGLTTRVESSNNKESLGEDASKQGRIDAIDANEEITLVSVHDVNVSAGEEVFPTTVDDITLAQVLEEMKSTKPKKKGVVIQDLSESTTTISSQQSQDKGKGILIEPVKPMNKKDLIRLDEETALNLQAEFDEEERLAREKAEKEKEVNIALIETWDDIQAKIDVDHQLAERMQAQEQEELSIEEKATLFQQILEKRRKHFAAKRVEDKRNKPPTKAQQRKIMCTYLKNMEGYMLKNLKLKEFDSIQEMFDKAFKRQKVEDDKETSKIKQLMEIIPDEEEVAIDAIHLAVKSPIYVDLHVGREEVSSYTTYTFNDVGKEASN
ncbi:hypothetical protein Tco_0352223 [Tanacetum coccineum]